VSDHARGRKPWRRVSRPPRRAPSSEARRTRRRAISQARATDSDQEERAPRAVSAPPLPPFDHPSEPLPKESRPCANQAKLPPSTEPEKRKRWRWASRSPLRDGRAMSETRVFDSEQPVDGHEPRASSLPPVIPGFDDPFEPPPQDSESRPCANQAKLPPTTEPENRKRWRWASRSPLPDGRAMSETRVFDSEQPADGHEPRASSLPPVIAGFDDPFEPPPQDSCPIASHQAPVQIQLAQLIMPTTVHPGRGRKPWRWASRSPLRADWSTSMRSPSDEDKIPRRAMSETRAEDWEDFQDEHEPRATSLPPLPPYEIFDDPFEPPPQEPLPHAGHQATLPTQFVVPAARGRKPWRWASRSPNREDWSRSIRSPTADDKMPRRAMSETRAEDFEEFLDEHELRATSLPPLPQYDFFDDPFEPPPQEARPRPSHQSALPIQLAVPILIARGRKPWRWASRSPYREDWSKSMRSPSADERLLRRAMSETRAADEFPDAHEPRAISLPPLFDDPFEPPPQEANCLFYGVR